MADGAEIPILQSLSDLRELVTQCLELWGARTVVEVGAESGALTAILGEWAAPRSGIVYAIEPVPDQGLLDVAERQQCVNVVAGRSPGCLVDLEPCDAYIIDGDHNYHTVLAELRTIVDIADKNATEPLMLLHDVGWPWGRRDLYYAPEALPPSSVRPYTFTGGIAPGFAGIADTGILEAGAWAAAREEGGAANGVQTAVDDFLETDARFTYLFIPVVFGLGILHRRAAPCAAQLDAAFVPLADNPVLRRLEENRLQLISMAQDARRSVDNSRLVIEDHARVVAERETLLAQSRDAGVLREELGRLRGELARARRELARMRLDRDRLTLHLLDSERDAACFERVNAELRETIAQLERSIADSQLTIAGQRTARWRAPVWRRP